METTARNTFGEVALERPQPFRSASSDLGLATMRCNNDFKFMPRGFADLKALVDAFRCDVKQLVACFQKFKATIEEYPVVQRMAMSIVALNAKTKVVSLMQEKEGATVQPSPSMCIEV